MGPVQKLSNLGFTFASNGLTTSGEARLGLSLHHTEVPVFVCALAVTRGRVTMETELDHADYTLCQLVLKRFSLDYSEAAAIWAACQGNISGVVAPNAPAFFEQVCRVISICELEPFFRVGPDARSHYDIRPTAFDFDRAQNMPDDMKRWKAMYRALPTTRKIMVATVMWLYRGTDDKTWLSRVPRRWPALGAIQELRAAGLVTDWAKLVALYPGW
jgi:hypothetical protein